MTTAEPNEVVVSLGDDRSLGLRFDFGAGEIIERITGEPVGKALAGLVEPFSVTTTLTITHACHVAYQRKRGKEAELTREELGGFLTLSNARDFLPQLRELFMGSMPEPEGEVEAGNPTPDPGGEQDT